MNIVPGYWTDAFQVALLGRDLGASVGIGALAYAFVQLNTYAVSVNRLPPRDARKIIHTCSAPLYMMLWPLFCSAPGARVFCAVVPLLNALRLVWAATGSTDRDGAAAVGEQDLAVAVSRSGNVREALGGPSIFLTVVPSSSSTSCAITLISSHGYAVKEDKCYGFRRFGVSRLHASAWILGCRYWAALVSLDVSVCNVFTLLCG